MQQRSINVFTAIRWVNQGWEEVKEETIQKCFRKAGLLNHQLSTVTSRTNVEEDCKTLFQDQCLQMIFVLLMNTSMVTTASVCDDFDKETWEEDVLANFNFWLIRPENLTVQFNMLV